MGCGCPFTVRVEVVNRRRGNESVINDGTLITGPGHFRQVYTFCPRDEELSNKEIVRSVLWVHLLKVSYCPQGCPYPFEMKSQVPLEIGLIMR